MYDIHTDTTYNLISQTYISTNFIGEYNMIDKQLRSPSEVIYNECTAAGTIGENRQFAGIWSHTLNAGPDTSEYHFSPEFGYVHPTPTNMLIPCDVGISNRTIINKEHSDTWTMSMMRIDGTPLNTTTAITGSVRINETLLNILLNNASNAVMFNINHNGVDRSSATGDLAQLLTENLTMRHSGRSHVPITNRNIKLLFTKGGLSKLTLAKTSTFVHPTPSRNIGAFEGVPTEYKYNVSTDATPKCGGGSNTPYLPTFMYVPNQNKRGEYKPGSTYYGSSFSNSDPWENAPAVGVVVQELNPDNIFCVDGCDTKFAWSWGGFGFKLKQGEGMASMLVNPYGLGWKQSGHMRLTSEAEAGTWNFGTPLRVQYTQNHYFTSSQHTTVNQTAGQLDMILHIQSVDAKTGIVQVGPVTNIDKYIYSSHAFRDTNWYSNTQTLGSMSLFDHDLNYTTPQKYEHVIKPGITRVDHPWNDDIFTFHDYQVTSPVTPGTLPNITMQYNANTNSIILNESKLFGKYRDGVSTLWSRKSITVPLEINSVFGASTYTIAFMGAVVQVPTTSEYVNFAVRISEKGTDSILRIKTPSQTGTIHKSITLPGNSQAPDTEVQLYSALHTAIISAITNNVTESWAQSISTMYGIVSISGTVRPTQHAGITTIAIANPHVQYNETFFDPNNSVLDQAISITVKAVPLATDQVIITTSISSVGYNITNVTTETLPSGINAVTVIFPYTATASYNDALLKPINIQYNEDTIGLISNSDDLYNRKKITEDNANINEWFD